MFSTASVTAVRWTIFGCRGFAHSMARHGAVHQQPEWMLFRLQEITRTGYVEFSFFASSTICKLNSLLARPLRPYSLSCTWQLLCLEDQDFLLCNGQASGKP